MLEGRCKLFELPDINCNLTQSALCAFVRKMTDSTGARSLVLGLSGGIDSAVVAFLLKKSGVKVPLKLYWLPYRSSDERSYQDACATAKALDENIVVRDISQVVDGALDSWTVKEKIRIGNIAARARMIALFDASAEHQGVVVGTSNLSERSLGYGTLHGDLACAFNPVANLFKTELRQLARHLGVPRSVIEKPPTADLWQGQTDESELGFTYANADRVLYLYGRCGLNRSEIVEQGGLEATLVNAVLKRAEAFEYKGRPISLGPPPL